jgi:hypothetical protein
MTDNNEEVLRRSLDAVDRHRNRLLIAVVVTAVLLLAAFVHGADAVHSGNTNRFLHAVMVVLGIWSALMTLVVVIQITTMTKRILRAIELASRK